ncbi:hypothetical protein M3Y98_00976100 [Aphelenchoides besseyi]|nr:hypothetical protein M3Y98_00976100 [Aphelenchoides besseyi]KAI6194995.1 hypothetical protein M3Y96_01184200 [Aphelenchoides besseyi]
MSSLEERKKILNQVKEEVERKSLEWFQIIKEKREVQKQAATERMKMFDAKFSKYYGDDVLQMSVTDFIEKFKKVPDVENVPEAPAPELGDQTLQALNDIDYLLKASHHDPETKAYAAKLKNALKKK